MVKFLMIRGFRLTPLVIFCLFFVIFIPNNLLAVQEIAETEKLVKISIEYPLIHDLYAPYWKYVLNDEDEKMDVSAEQVFTARNVTRIVQDLIANRLFDASMINGDGDRKNALWGTMTCGKSFFRGNIPYESKPMGGIIGYDLINSCHKIFGLIAGTTKVKINYTGENFSDNGKQDSVYLGAYGAVKIPNDFTLSGLLIVEYTSFHFHRNLKGFYNEEVNSKSQGVSLFNKLSLECAIIGNSVTFIPTVSLYLDFLKECAHGEKNNEKELLYHKKNSDFFAAWEVGMHCTSSNFSNAHGIRPNIFIGYEFDIANHNSSRKTVTQGMEYTDQFQNRNRNCFVMKIVLDFDLFSNCSADVGYIGNFSEKIRSNVIFATLNYKF